MQPHPGDLGIQFPVNYREHFNEWVGMRRRFPPAKNVELPGMQAGYRLIRHAQSHTKISSIAHCQPDNGLPIIYKFVQEGQRFFFVIVLVRETMEF